MFWKKISYPGECHMGTKKTAKLLIENKIKANKDITVDIQKDELIIKQD